MQEFAKLDLTAQLNAVHTAIFGWPLDPLSPTAELMDSGSLQEATHKLLLTDRVRSFTGFNSRSFLQLDLRSQLDIVHIAIFGWPLDHLSPIADLLATGSLQQATHKLMGTERARWFTREAIPTWPTDKWVCAEFSDLRIWVNLNDSYVAQGVLHGNWENEEVGFVLDNLSPGDSMIDVGANVGVYALQAARVVGPEGRIHAFEPQTDTFNMLSRSVHENGFEDRCILHNFALGDKDSSVTIWRHHANNPGASIITSQENVSEGAGNATALKRLDSMDFDRPVKLLKMDIEGYEPLLVTGGEAFFRKHRPIIVTEWFPRSMQQVAGLSSDHYFRQLTGLGYKVHLLNGRRLGDAMTHATMKLYDEINEPFNIACMPQ